jgi:glyoxylase-like metal-dependent hydrolase (beta-lactamase superfamily II)
MSIKNLFPPTLFLFLLLFSFEGFAQSRFDKVEIKAEKLSDNMYVLFGSGGNIGVLVGDDGVLMIDDQFAPLSEKITAAIAKLSNKPIHYLINTHWHGDHSGGNENFAKKGATILAHQNVRKRMSEGLTRSPERVTPPAPTIALPVITFSEDMTLHFNGEDIMAIHVHNAHTDGDAQIYFPKNNVLHMGDTYFNGRWPFIDIQSGGSIDGYINALNHALFLVDDATQIIPGHGKMSNRKELMAYRDTLLTVRTRIKNALAKGQSIDEMKNGDILKEWPDYGSGYINDDTIIETIAKSLAQ